MKGNSFLLISQLIRGPWAIDQDYANEMLPQVARLLNHEPVSFYESSAEENAQASMPVYAYMEGSGRISFIDEAFESDLPENSLLILRQNGVVMKEDFCGVAGTASLRSHFLQAMASPKIIGSVVQVDSPGGAVNGTLELTNALYNCAKPVIGLADGFAASAGYMELCGCAEIYATSENTMVGSVGVMTTIRDYSERLKAMGVKEIVLTARTSPDKNATTIEAMAGNDERMQNEVLIPLHQNFQEAVRRTRTEAGEDYLKGGVYVAKKAMEGDLIDGIRSLEETIERAMELGMLMKNPNKYV